MQGTSGKFFGSTPQGGAGSGTIFSFDTGLAPFVSFVHDSARIGQTFGILGQGLKGATGVSINGAICNFNIKSDTLIVATVPSGAATGYVTVATVQGILTSNVELNVIP